MVYDTFESPLGTLYLIYSKNLLVGISFKKPFKIAFKREAMPRLFIKELNDYFNGRGHTFTQKTRFLKGTDFEKKVWQCLTDIPFGETRTYKWVAERIGSPLAMRAVGQALSKNPIPIVFPCHRVIESDGSLGGYSSGVDIKRRLLEMEYYFNNA